VSASHTGPTDEQIRAAVDGARSWNDTARALGFKGLTGGAMRSVKMRVAKLGIDTSHFTHQRRWSDEQLRQAIIEATSWTGVLRTLNIGERSRLSVKWHATRLGLDVSHLDPPTREIPTEVAALALRRDKIPIAAESFAVAWFTMRDIPTAVPAHPAAYDLLATFPEGVRRVQVKTTTYRGKHGTWTVNVGRRPYALDKSARRTAYRPNELDYFFIVDGDAAVYLIPSSVLAGRTEMSVGAYRQFIVGDASSLFADAPALTPSTTEGSP
jgi:hypothetical protein